MLSAPAHCHVYSLRDRIHGNVHATERPDTALDAERALAGGRRECQPPELGHHGRLFWSPVLCYAAGLATSARPAYVHEHTGVDGLDLRSYRELLLVPGAPGRHLRPVGVRLLDAAAAPYAIAAPVVDCPVAVASA